MGHVKGESHAWIWLKSRSGGRHGVKPGLCGKCQGKRTIIADIHVREGVERADGSSVQG